MRVKTEAKRDSIVRAASEVFLEMGFEGASMAEIASRVGGSKATLYSYFTSKEDLFREVTFGAAKTQFEPIIAALSEDTSDIAQALQKFGEQVLAVVCNEASIQATRAIIAESGRSDVGRRFFANGPQKGLDEIARVLAEQMAKGVLRDRDPRVAALHLKALLHSETVNARLYGIEKSLTRSQIRHAVRRAIDTFLAGFGSAETLKKLSADQES